MTVWRGASYRKYCKQFICPVCGNPSVDAAHVAGIMPRGYGIKVEDWCCVGMCRECHSRMDGKINPPLTQDERELVVKQLVISLGSYLESLTDGDARRDLPKFGERKARSKRGPRLKMGERRRP